MSGGRPLSHNPRFRHQQAGAGGKQKMISTNRYGQYSLRLRNAARAKCICAQNVVLCSTDAVSFLCSMCPCMMEVNNSLLKMNAINISSHFLIHIKIKCVVYIAILLNFKFFIHCPKLQLALQYNTANIIMVVFKFQFCDKRKLFAQKLYLAKRIRKYNRSPWFCFLIHGHSVIIIYCSSEKMCKLQSFRKCTFDEGGSFDLPVGQNWKRLVMLSKMRRSKIWPTLNYKKMFYSK